MDINSFINKKFSKTRRRSFNVSKKSINNYDVEYPSKIAIMMVGIPGSGKTGAKYKCSTNYPKTKFVNIDPDEFLEHFYENDRRHYHKAFKAAAKLLDRTIAEGRSLILDGTGVNLFKNIDRLHAEGYYISLCINLLDKETCKVRAQSRFEKTGRRPNFSYIDMVHAKHKVNIQLYLESPKVMDAFVFSNDCEDGRRKLICTKRLGNCNIEVINLLY